MPRRLQPLDRRASRVALVAVAFGLGACGPRQAPLSAAPVGGVATSRPIGGPLAPVQGLGFPSLAVAWTPPMLTAGDPRARAMLGP